MILNFQKPPRARPTAEHNEAHQSDTNIAGTYTPNMSKEWRLTWKAKHIKGRDHRVEIRKGLDNGVQVLMVVRLGRCSLSANGKMEFDEKSWAKLSMAYHEAEQIILDEDLHV